MVETAPPGCTAFAGSRRIASGDLASVAAKVKQAVDRDERAAILVFDDVTSEPVEIDTRGTPEQVLRRIAVQQRQPSAVGAADPSSAAPRGPGRPKLGVVAREVTLLPRHWEWLSSQPGGASVALRKLVEEARRASAAKDRVRLARESCYRFMVAMAGDRPGFEEAIRALFAGERQRFVEQTKRWPVDVRVHAGKLAAAAFPDPAG
jgi:hypothetical protein